MIKENQEIEQIASLDKLISGATLLGINQAILWANQGQKVLIMERQTFPLSEIIGIGKYWLELAVLESIPLAEELFNIFESYGRKIETEKSVYLTFHPDQTAVAIEKLLLEKGIELLYACDLLELSTNQAIIASKSGRNRLGFLEYLDCRLDKQDEYCEAVIELSGANLSGVTQIKLPEGFDIFENKLRVYESFVDCPIHYLTFRFPAPKLNKLAYGDIAYQVKEIAWQIVEYLVNEDVRFKETILGSISDSIGPFPKENGILEMEAEVLVVGGGSSGALAAIESANAGANTLLVDLNPGLGGTGTFGGVDSYWFGHLRGFSKKLSERVIQLEKAIGYPQGRKWSIEAKKYALLQLVKNSGCHFLPEAISYEAIMNGDKICGVYVITPVGTVRIVAKRIIDATGDGDIAAFAGAKFNYGSSKDQTVMWFSLPQYKAVNEIQNNFTSMVCVADLQDYSRGIITGRRRNSGLALYKHGSYLATRESRHILGDVQLTVTDELLHRAWPDVVNIHFSNHDMKGLNTADWLNLGLIPPNLEIEIPFRALLPQKIDHLLVVGKAISATHDAFPAIRMQADLENLGGIAGQIAALSVKQTQSFRELDIKEIQRIAVDKEILPESILTRELSMKSYTTEELTILIEEIEDYPLYDYAQMPMEEIFRKKIPFIELCTIGPKIVPLIKEKISRMTGLKKRHLAQVLAFYGDLESVPILLDMINQELSGEVLPKRTADIWYVTEPPDHGAMPDVCYLLYSLGMVGSKEAMNVWESIVEKIPDNPVAFKDKKWGLFYYVHALTLAAERQENSDFIPILLKLHQKEVLNNLVCHQEIQDDYFLERRAMLELAIGRALARCGASEGFEILKSYLEDSRYLFKTHAKQELSVLTQDVSYKEKGLHIQDYQKRVDIVESSEKIFRSINEFKGVRK